MNQIADNTPETVAIPPPVAASSDEPPAGIRPRRPVRSLKDFLYELGTITAGVLIALSIDSLVEWRSDRALVRQAHAPLRQELSDNRTRVQDERASLEKLLLNVQAGLQRTEDLLNKRPSKVQEVELNLGQDELTDASWQTAGRTGAFAHMAYADLQRYSTAYTHQHIYAEHRRRLLSQLANTYAYVGSLGGDTASAKDLEALRERLLALGADVDVALQMNKNIAGIFTDTLGP